MGCSSCKTLDKLKNGAIGVLKIVSGDRANSEVIEARQRECLKCKNHSRSGEHKSNFVRVNDICKACGCIIVAKSAIGSEKCPEGKW